MLAGKIALTLGVSGSKFDESGDTASFSSDMSLGVGACEQANSSSSFDPTAAGAAALTQACVIMCSYPGGERGSENEQRRPVRISNDAVGDRGAIASLVVCATCAIDETRTCSTAGRALAS